MSRIGWTAGGHGHGQESNGLGGSPERRVQTLPPSILNFPRIIVTVDLITKNLLTIGLLERAQLLHFATRN